MPSISSASHQIDRWYCMMDKGRHGGKDQGTPNNVRRKISKCNTQRLYISSKEGGWGYLLSTILNKTHSIRKYISKIDISSELVRKYLKGIIAQSTDSWTSWLWNLIKKAGLKDNITELIKAAQEQALSVKSIQTKVWHTRQNSWYKLSKNAPEMD